MYKKTTIYNPPSWDVPLFRSPFVYEHLQEFFYSPKNVLLKALQKYEFSLVVFFLGPENCTIRGPPVFNYVWYYISDKH